MSGPRGNEVCPTHDFVMGSPGDCLPASWPRVGSNSNPRCASRVASPLSVTVTVGFVRTFAISLVKIIQLVMTDHRYRRSPQIREVGSGPPLPVYWVICGSQLVQALPVGP